MEENYEEKQYLQLIQRILKKGAEKMDRTGTGTIAVFGDMSRYSLEGDRFPLLTTKRVPFRIVAEELLFFIRGQTNNKILKSKNVNIWTLNGTEEFLRSRGISRKEDDLGPIYGFQWRHFGAEYGTCNDDYSGKGVDQLKSVIEELKKNPNSRRMVVSAWNPLDLDAMALPPCHVLFQFCVVDGKLNCMLYQRSGDVGLGVPFNIASYALLLKMVSYLTNIPAGEFVHVLSDAHIYLNHVEQLSEQVKRTPYAFPTLKIAPAVPRKSIDEFEIEDFVLEEYIHHPPIKMNMSA
ncbi:thymidylate synthase 3 [Nematocida ausubeli]|uniref:thymidylate synthase n=1 Tax=Nematocida ausubeli (strain ATCC PRA-371 / ERTm2) TaxID=1913371 RepID=A0A086J1L9_NEMA1|nr:thymidylate synthase 3 [Nematocida ausubeli]KAI5135214.1 thymidylate synthase [Nematocida ausubeli]KFG26037.1 thymidylate synthase 3 [Nematocida ausubeli]